MQRKLLTVAENVPLTDDVYKMTLIGDGLMMKSGQFVEIALPEFSLRRPISVADSDDGKLTIVYRVVGRGTDYMSGVKQGEKLDVLIDLGNGFDTENVVKPLLIGGGIGCPPMYKLAKEFASRGIRPQIVLGFKTAKECFMLEEFSRLGEVTVCTDDGSYGIKGNVINAIKQKKIDFDCYYACGPQIMLKFLAKEYKNGFLSMEARMGCGFGACMGCSIVTTNGYKRVCKEGPVFKADEVIFEG